MGYAFLFLCIQGEMDGGELSEEILSVLAITYSLTIFIINKGNNLPPPCSQPGEMWE